MLQLPWKAFKEHFVQGMAIAKSQKKNKATFNIKSNVEIEKLNHSLQAKREKNFETLAKLRYSETEVEELSAGTNRVFIECLVEIQVKTFTISNQ